MGTHTSRNVVAAAMTAATTPTGEMIPNERDIKASVNVWSWSPGRPQRASVGHRIRVFTAAFKWKMSCDSCHSNYLTVAHWQFTHGPLLGAQVPGNVMLVSTRARFRTLPTCTRTKPA